MKAQRLLDERVLLSEEAFAELRVVRVPTPISGCTHELKYSLAWVVGGVCVLRYDNEPGKGDHRHVGEVEMPYRFSTPEALLADFWRDVDQWKESR